MSGNSKSNTGIGFIDNPVNEASRQIDKLGKGVEKYGQRTLQTAGNVLTGKWNNIGQDILMMNPYYYAGVEAVPGGRNAVGETGTERAVREAAQKEAETAAADAAAQVAEADRVSTAQLTAVVNNRKRAPGRAQTLISGGSVSRNTLITPKGSN